MLPGLAKCSLTGSFFDAIYDPDRGLTSVASKPSPIAETAKTGSGLPDFQQPPVDEVALSIQFPPIPGFNVQHYGLYFQRTRKEYPRFDVQPPITNLREQFGKGHIGRQLGLTLVDAPEVRAWYLDESGSRLIQIQRDRFVHNWRKVTGNEAYPRYPSIRESLEKEWLRFCEFLRDERLERPKVNQCEVLYVNNIEYGKGWNGFGELEKVIATLSTPKPKNRFLPSPERVSMQVVYRLEEDAGRLYVQFNPVIRARDGTEVLQMSLTARGAPKSSSNEDVFAWLDLGRKWVVRGFADFTTPEMHRVWGIQ
jgi:uncharacterized protein (TIGR04255 family)